MSNVLWVTLIAAGLIAMLVQNQLAQNKQDKVAKAILESNDVILKSNAAIGTAAVKANKENAIALGSIHTLVNSNLSEAKKGKLEATRLTLTALEEVLDIKKAQGLTVSEESRAIIAKVKGEIAEMASESDHIDQQTEIAKAEVEVEEAKL